MTNKTIHLPIFSAIEINATNFKCTYNKTIWKYDFNGTPIDLDINFYSLSEKNIALVAPALERLTEIHQIAEAAYLQDFEQGKEAKEYIEEWRDDLLWDDFNEEEYTDFIKDTDPNLSLARRLLSLIRVVRIGFYPDSPDTFVTVDFAFGYDDEEEQKGWREHMIVVKLNSEFEVTEVCTEG
ncbi:MAG: DUF2004 domain-containing protein [Saprospiraceae bacterium]